MEHQHSNMACISPFGVRDKVTGLTISVPCGKCHECTKRKISEWSFRLMQEEKTATSAYFVTLTYGTKYVPISRAGYLTLNKKHLQNFFKRLRFNTGNTNIKYYAVGEYGTENWRPHYHAIIFNLESEFNVTDAWVTDKRTTEKPEAIGECHFGTVTGASIGYCLKYIAKRGRIPVHRNDDRLPEFALQSKRLGSSYINEASRQWHHDDLVNRMHIVLEGGKKASMPRYFKDQIYTKADREEIAAVQAPKIEERMQKTINEKYGGDYYKWSRDENEKTLAAIRASIKNSNKSKGKL